MAVFVIADLHLSTAARTNKSMEVFGARWQNYTEKLARNWQALVGEDDTVVIPGDISWAMTLAEAADDLRFIHRLPGKKILCKGNHDFWWSSMQKNLAFLEAEDLHTLRFLYHSAVRVEDFIFCGTRGWFCEDPENTDDPQTLKLIAREALRLEMSLKEAVKLKEQYPDCEIIPVFHFPPVWAGTECKPLTDLLRAYGIRRCYYGHIHGAYGQEQVTDCGDFRTVMVSADYLSFTPLHVPPEL